MPDSQQIDPVLVEKVIEAIAEATGGMVRPHIMRRAAERSTAVVFDELGLKEQRRTHTHIDHDIPPLPLPDGPQVRLVSRWRPVEQGDTK